VIGETVLVVLTLLGRHNANQIPPYAILFLGNTGVGKSHLTEDLVGQGDLADSSVESGTSKVTPYKTQSGLIVIDTPGLADTEGKTLEYLDAIVKEASSRRCLPAIVVKYGDKIGPQCVACLEALSICLDLGNYVLIINNITSGQRGKTKQVDVIAQMISKVTEIIGGPPVKTIPHWNGSLFTEDKLLLPLPVCISSKVSTLKQLWKATSTKHARIEKIRQQMHQYMLCKQNLLDISSTVGKDGLSRLAHGPSELRSSIATNFEYRHYGRAALGALALPLAEVGHRIVGGCELLSLLLTSPAELVIDGVKINWQRPTANEQRFLVHNQERVQMLFNKLENAKHLHFVCFIDCAVQVKVA